MALSSDTDFTLTPIATLAGCYPDKFGVPRQPGLAAHATATLNLLPPFNQPDCVRGLEAFSHLWLHFIFNQSPEKWSPLVRPPRLGGNARVGVFASRATHRPNRLGLSLVELIDVQIDQGVRLIIRGHDLVDGTPIVDIKPYLPWADSTTDARAGFAPAPPLERRVIFSARARRALADMNDSAQLEALVTEVLAQDPRPAYQHGKTGRIHGVRLNRQDIHFHAMHTPEGETVIEVVDIIDLP
ncbi:tRNA (N6-threonylcarbamoyladenosine(37)-N6)-methyltransferase TrmO [Larsenimonas rhizosphaerae]|uniref:tRNA (N6-threonylcarbamoyladenosine(37)-N6)-methyltransferase TrmO n=1 Tax=Larsenimonas rhizosphaerae TaxID=2944682 RepID=A0AA41ZJP9_9GAMM|nr:tRNA (N6-threonylcarbamoyladenosine(37)-N6)-methyltransferase TrmO [Larsenimonas rhizosphaerae]MCX2522808.1 tRNA (N6-threonylcarbamoyladenosine(37)-N6)-methyltransferase TrmO [Larsenimonas rhizosphaerae]